jgi:hypothetical protein
VVDKVALGQVSTNTLVSPANSHSTNCFIFINHVITNTDTDTKIKTNIYCLFLANVSLSGQITLNGRIPGTTEENHSKVRVVSNGIFVLVLNYLSILP